MKAKFNYLVFTLLLINISCVQKSYDRIMILELKVDNIKNIRSVGVRGSDKPLNWNTDYPLKLDQKDHIYKTTVKMNTGYLFTEIKFVVNGEIELENKGNRKLTFNTKDTVRYEAQYNRPE